MSAALRPEPYAQKLSALSATNWRGSLSAQSTNILGLSLWQSATQADPELVNLFKQRAQFAFLRQLRSARSTWEFFRRHWHNDTDDKVPSVFDTGTTVLPIDALPLDPAADFLLIQLQEAWTHHPQLLQRPLLQERASAARQFLLQLKQQAPAIEAILGKGRVRGSMFQQEGEVLAFFNKSFERVTRWAPTPSAALAIQQIPNLISSKRNQVDGRQLIMRQVRFFLAHLAETLMLPSLFYDFGGNKAFSTFEQFLASVNVEGNEQLFAFLSTLEAALQRAPDRRKKTFLFYLSPTIHPTYADLVNDPVIFRRLQGEQRTVVPLTSSWQCSSDVKETYERLATSHRDVLYVIELEAGGRTLAPVFSKEDPAALILLPGTQLTVFNMRLMYHPLVSALMLEEQKATSALMIVLYCKITGGSLPPNDLAVRKFHKEQFILQNDNVLAILTSLHRQIGESATASAGALLWSGVDHTAVVLSAGGVEARRKLSSGTPLAEIRGPVFAWPDPTDNQRSYATLLVPLAPKVALYIDITDHLTGKVQHRWTWPKSRAPKGVESWIPFFANTEFVRKQLSQSSNSGSQLMWVTTRDVDQGEELTFDYSEALFFPEALPIFRWNLQGAPIDMQDKLERDYDLQHLAKRSKIIWTGASARALVAGSAFLPSRALDTESSIIVIYDMNTFAGTVVRQKLEYKSLDARAKVLWETFLHLVRFDELLEDYTALSAAQCCDVKHLGYSYAGKTISLGFGKFLPGTKEPISPMVHAIIKAGWAFANYVSTLG